MYSIKPFDLICEKVDGWISRVAGACGLLPYSRTVMEKLNRKNLTMGVPMLALVFSESIYRLYLLLNYLSVVEDTERPRAFFIYSMVVLTSLLMGVAFVLDRRRKIRYPKVAALIIYSFMWFHLCYGFQMATEQNNVMDFFNMFFMSVMMNFILFNVRPVVVLLLCLLFNQIVIRWTSRFMPVDDATTQQMLMVAVCLVSMIRYNMVMGAVRLEEKLEQYRDELKNKNEELSLRNEQLLMLSGTDGLTGLSNRFALRREFDSFIGREICVMMSDIDDFKYYNDNFGHEVGDEVLIRYATLLKECFRDTHLYRYGGDEFLLISELKPKEFVKAVDEFMKKLLEVSLNDMFRPPTTSAGVVCGNCRNATVLRSMFSMADRCLYKAKQQGKNQYVLEESIGEIREIDWNWSP